MFDAIGTRKRGISLLTRMHSSRMRTVRSVSRLPGGVCFRGGGCASRGVCFLGGGGVLPGGCFWGGAVPGPKGGNCPGTPPPLWTDRHV